MHHISCSVIAAGCWFLTGAATAATPVPQADGWVLDQIGVLSPDTESRLEVELTEFAYSHNHEIAVLLIRGSAQEGLATFGQRVLRTWGLGGDEGRVALLLWSREQGITIQTGAAAGAVMDEDQQELILRETVGPAIVGNQPERGIVEGVQQIIAALSEAADAAPTAEEIAEFRAQPAAMPAVPIDFEPELPAPAEAEYTIAPSESMVLELDRILQNLVWRPGDTVQALAPQIGAQARALPGVLAQGLRELSGEPVSEPLGETRRGLFIALAVCVLIGLVTLLRQSWLGVAVVFGLFVPPLLAAVTGFVALSLAVFALAAASPILGKLLPVVLRAVFSQPGLRDNAADDPRWRARPNQVAPPPQSNAKPSLPASATGKASGRAQTAPPLAPGNPRNSQPPALERALAANDWPALKQHFQSVAGDVLPKPRGWYIAVLIVLYLVAPMLAVIALLGLPAYYAYKLLTLDASRRERLLANPRVRDRLRQLERKHPELYLAISRLQQTLMAARSGS